MAESGISSKRIGRIFKVETGLRNEDMPQALRQKIADALWGATGVVHVEGPFFGYFEVRIGDEFDLGLGLPSDEEVAQHLIETVALTLLAPE